MIRTAGTGLRLTSLFLLIVLPPLFLFPACRSTQAALDVASPTKEPAAEGPVFRYDSVYCLTQRALYRELTARSRWDEARVPWQIIYRGCGSQRPNFYIDGGNIYRNLALSGTDSVLREARVDTLLSLYEYRIAHFADSGSVNGRLGLDLLHFRPDEKQRAFRHLRRAVNTEREACPPAVLLAFLNTALDLNRLQQTDTAVVLTVFVQVQQYLNRTVDGSADAVRQADKALLTWADCGTLGRYFSDRVESADTMNLRMITRLFAALNCYDHLVFRQATLRLHKLDPGPQSALLLGYSAFRQGDFNTALTYFTAAAAQYQDPKQKAACYVAAGRSYLALRNLTSARDMADRALQLQPAVGAAFLLRGEIYMAAAADCGGGNELTEAAVYWLAEDQFLQAARNDQALAEEAGRLAASCQLHFPSASLLFFHHLNEGDSYTVTCWIQQKTKVRARRD